MMTLIRLALCAAVFAATCFTLRADDAASLTSHLPPCGRVEVAVGKSGQFKPLPRPATEALQGDWTHLTYSPGGTAGTPEYVVRFYSGKTLVGEEGISFASSTVTFIKSDKYPNISGTVAFDPASPRAQKLESELKAYSK